MKVTVNVGRGGKNSYDCIVRPKIKDFTLVGYGSTAKEAIEDLEISCNDAAKMTGDDVFLNLEKEYVFDVGSMFNYYDFLNIEGVAKLSGIKPSVLRQYASGVRNPKPEKLRLISDAVRTASRKIQCVVLGA